MTIGGNSALGYGAESSAYLCVCVSFNQHDHVNVVALYSSFNTNNPSQSQIQICLTQIITTKQSYE
jgi:hypothetical protein